MAENKTVKTGKSVEKFLNTIDDDQKRQDCFALLKLMKSAAGKDAEMWGDAIVGFGDYTYQYESGRSGDWFMIGFSPRKQSLVVYTMSGLQRHAELLNKLGKHKTGKGCLYIQKLADVDTSILKQILKDSVAYLKKSKSAA